MAEIIVTGYPRSGNTWLSWLLGDVLYCPVGGMYAAKPLCTEGKERPKHHQVYQLHLRPMWEGDFDKAVPSAWCLFVPKMGEAPYKICHVVRDPRDVAVSICHYWNLPSLNQALNCMINGVSPLKVHLTWNEHVGRWLQVKVPFIRYEDLQADTAGTITKLLNHWGIRYPEHRLEAAISRQRFSKKRAQIEIDGDSRVYNKGIHLHHMRKGIAGDWKNHFNAAQLARAREAFGEIAQELGYEL